MMSLFLSLNTKRIIGGNQGIKKKTCIPSLFPLKNITCQYYRHKYDGNYDVPILPLRTSIPSLFPFNVLFL